MIKIYGTHCPKCKVIEKKLEQMGQEFEMIDDPDLVIKFGEEHSMNTMPIVVDGDKVMDFMEANKYINSLNR